MNSVQGLLAQAPEEVRADQHRANSHPNEMEIVPMVINDILQMDWRSALYRAMITFLPPPVWFLISRGDNYPDTGGFGEDYSRVRTANGAENMSTIKHVALNKLQAVKPEFKKDLDQTVTKEIGLG